jgi:DNA repair protein REV1
LSNELTLAKIKEFSKMKVVRPSWIIESVEKQTLLRWQNFILLPGQTSRVDASGAKATQKSLFAFQSPGKASTSVAKPEPLSLPNSGAGEITEDVVPLILVVSPAEARDEPVYLTDPLTFEQAAQMPSYAVHKSNPSASRLMQSKEWRAAHTSVANDFVEKYFKNSRLHHLSTWKEELKVLVRKAKEGDEKQSSGEQAKDSVSMKGSDIKLRLPSPLKAKGKGKQSDNEGRVIMHCDFDSFFVSAGLIGRPELKGKPVVVCHANSGEGVGESSTSEIASSSYEARAAGVKNGMRYSVGYQLFVG